MTIDKAIELLTDLAKPIREDENPDHSNAINLGIEALKRLKANRQDPEFDHWVPLPGETQD